MLSLSSEKLAWWPIVRVTICSVAFCLGLPDSLRWWPRSLSTLLHIRMRARLKNALLRIGETVSFFFRKNRTFTADYLSLVEGKHPCLYYL